MSDSDSLTTAQRHLKALVGDTGRHPTPALADQVAELAQRVDNLERVEASDAP